MRWAHAHPAKGGTAKEGSMVFRAMISNTLAFIRKRFGLHTNGTAKNREPEREWRQLPVLCEDASLLFRRMGLLRIHADELARDEPLRTRELQARCVLCSSKDLCIEDVIAEEDTSEPQDWRDYCPNAAVLNAIGAIQNCPRAAQYLKVPYADS
jgi:hypothetical protein